MPLTVRLIVGLVLVLAGALLVTVAVLGARSRLPRNRFAGVRTAATLHSEHTFALANRVAAPLVAAAGATALAGGAVILAGGPGAIGWVVLAVTGIGTLVLSGLGGALGDRAAARLAAAEPAPAPCGGTCAGCDLVAGCRPTGETDQTAGQTTRQPADETSAQA
ncbi:SdpI family protein [Pseudonocardia sp. H11422]|uniref:SdpI family protein n=1 Tax=Pseudonocardia sp. H11422 TaxID=2835866 RepID=UPI001BDD9520|nr:SdpI family protein [Pseudonocardia sp. H11422]